MLGLGTSGVLREGGREVCVCGGKPKFIITTTKQAKREESW